MVQKRQRLVRRELRHLAETNLVCLAKDPAERPADAEMLAEELLACQDAGSWWRDHPLEVKAATGFRGEATVTIAT